MEAVSDEFMQETYEIFKAVYDGDATACYSLGEYYAVVDEDKTKSPAIFSDRRGRFGCDRRDRLLCLRSARGEPEKSAGS